MNDERYLYAHCTFSVSSERRSESQLKKWTHPLPNRRTSQHHLRIWLPSREEPLPPDSHSTNHRIRPVNLTSDPSTKPLKPARRLINRELHRPARLRKDIVVASNTNRACCRRTMQRTVSESQRKLSPRRPSLYPAPVHSAPASPESKARQGYPVCRFRLPDTFAMASMQTRGSRFR